MRRLRRVLAACAAAVVLLGVLLIVVFPTRTYFAQRASIADAESELGRLEDQRQQLEARVEDLQSSEAVEEIAREDYGMVYPGEEPYGILPTPPPEIDLPDVWPFDALEEHLADTRS